MGDLPMPQGELGRRLKDARRDRDTYTVDYYEEGGQWWASCGPLAWTSVGPYLSRLRVLAHEGLEFCLDLPRDKCVRTLSFMSIEPGDHSKGRATETFVISGRHER